MKKFMLALPIGTGILFGGIGVFVRQLNAAGLDNHTIMFVRSLFAVLEMFLVILIQDKNKLKIRWKDFPVFIGTGLLGSLLTNLCYNASIARLPLALSAVLLSLAPVFVLLLASVLFGEVITRKKVECIILALIGCTFASGLVENGLQSLEISGILFGILGAFFYGLYSIFSRIATNRSYHTYTVIFYSMLLLTIVLVPFASYSAIGDFIAAAPAKSIGFLCIHSLCTSVLPYVFLTVSLTHLEAGKVSILSSGGEPVAAVIFGFLFYQEQPSIFMLLGIVMTVAALTFFCMPEKQTK